MLSAETSFQDEGTLKDDDDDDADDDDVSNDRDAALTETEADIPVANDIELLLAIP